MANWFTRKLGTIQSIFKLYGLRGLCIGTINYLGGYEVLEGLPIQGSGQYPRKKKDPPVVSPVRAVMPARPIAPSWVTDEAESCADRLQYNYAVCERNINPDPAHSRGKILMLSHELSRTGAPGVLLEAARVLCEEGYTVTMVAPEQPNPQTEEMIRDFVALGIQVYLDKSLMAGRWNKNLPVTPTCSPFFDKLCEQYDMVFCNSFSVHNVVKDLNGTKKGVIWWLHEGSETYVDGHTAFFPLPIRENVSVYCVGRYAQQTLKDFGVDIPNRSLLYGIVDRAALHPIIPHEKVRFVLCGSIFDRKNQLLLIKAVELLSPPLREKAEFILIGGNGDEAYYQKVVKAAQGYACIRMLGTMPNSDVLDWYAASDCVVLPSIDDPMPVVLTEGMMLRRIILCSDRTGTSAYIREGINGFVFSHKDASELAEKIAYIIEHVHDPAMDALRENGRKVFEEQFTTDIFRKNLLSAVEEAIAYGKQEKQI